MKKSKDHQVWPRALLLLFITSQICLTRADTRPATTTAAAKLDLQHEEPTSLGRQLNNSHTEPSIKTWRLVRSPSEASDVPTLPESEEAEGRFIIIDGGNTDTIGISEFLICFGAIALAIVCALALLGILLAILDGISATPAAGPTTYSYGGTPAVADSYSLLFYSTIIGVTKLLEKPPADKIVPTRIRRLESSRAKLSAVQRRVKSNSVVPSPCTTWTPSTSSIPVYDLDPIH
ncbi:hypothetical protein FHG87_003569 [Trinorchestia longiramus]|nr:hypothetical protein FHG87_003569 [Trinorchestia longiramus]